MRFKLALGSILSLLLWTHESACAQNAGPLISQPAARRHGLERVWFTQLNLDRSRDRLAYLVQNKDLLLAQTYHGLLYALDAETGKQLWRVEVGPGKYPTLAPAINGKHIAVINGSTRYILDRATGKFEWSRECKNPPGAGPALTRTRVFVPMFNGRIESYLIEQQKQPPWVYNSIGRMLVEPLATPRSICWTTDKGYLYVGRPEFTGVRFRVESRDTITSKPAYSAPNVLAASSDGFVYCVHELSGAQKWKFSTGSPISQSPVAIGERIFALPDRAGMHCLNAEDGAENWWVPNVEKFLAAGAQRLYCTDRTGRILVLDSASGARVGALETPAGIDFFHTNTETDRLLLCTQSGLIQCLREIGLEKPLYYGVDWDKAISDGEGKAAEENQAGENAAPDLENSEAADDEAPSEEAPEEAAPEDADDAAPEDPSDPFDNGEFDF